MIRVHRFKQDMTSQDIYTAMDAMSIWRMTSSNETAVHFLWTHGLSELRAKTGIVGIPLQQIHRCSGVCPKLVHVVMGDGTPCMKSEDLRCNKNGIIENSVIRIATYVPDEFSEAGCGLGFPRRSPILYGDEIVIKDKRVNIEFTYPMINPMTFVFESASGFTRKKLIELIVTTYVGIYAEEAKSIRDRPLLQMNESGQYVNRSTPDHPRETNGHDICDLWIEGIQYHHASRTVVLSMGS